MSRRRAPKDICSWPTEVIPPAGNQPVRTASSNRASARMMSGMASRTAIRTARERRVAARRVAAHQTPTGMASAHAVAIAVVVRSSVFRTRGHRRGATGLP